MRVGVVAVLVGVLAVAQGARGAELPSKRVLTLEAAKASDHWKTPLIGPNRGRGIASGYWFNIGLKSAVTATLQEGISGLRVVQSFQRQ